MCVGAISFAAVVIGGDRLVVIGWRVTATGVKHAWALYGCTSPSGQWTPTHATRAVRRAKPHPSTSGKRTAARHAKKGNAGDCSLALLRRPKSHEAHVQAGVLFRELDGPLPDAARLHPVLEGAPVPFGRHGQAADGDRALGTLRGGRFGVGGIS